MDFDSLGDVHEGDRVIEVWIPTGRDQATVLKSMIDDTFVPNYGIGVNLRLVDGSAVLPAVVAGIGPDLVLSMGLPDPVNFAMRNAAVDLTRFPDFPEIRTRFEESAMVPFEFNGGYFALPETQIFNVMFYRTDVLADLGVEPPQTWDDVQALMPTLQRNNMAIGIPAVGDPLNPNLSGFLTQLYQRDGFLYNDAHSRAILDSEESLAAFEAYTRFFTHLGSPQQFDFNNRFRSGEMPIGFADFTNFNTLAVFAPEIHGLWNFGLMPGIKQPDGSINRTVSAHGAAVIMFEQSQRQELAWEFLKWWTSADAQLRFGRELESIMGAAARFPTANIEAFARLPWSSGEMDVITTQREWTLGTPEVPGGYYVSRHLLNAIRRVINENVDTRETILDFNIVIHRELINKRREFGIE
jgi:ABC-type glycerol-3-phosphate transport system substrate-binding protein